MSRFLAFRNFMGVRHFLHPNRKTSFSDINNNGVHCAVGTPFSLYRLYYQYRHLLREDSTFSLHKIGRYFLKNGGSYRNFHSISASNSISHRAEVAWRRLSQRRVYNGPALPPINSIACAVSLAVTRSNLMAPGVIAFIIGELTWTRQTWAAAESFQGRDILCKQAQGGHVYLTTFVSLLLEGIILLLRAVYLAILFAPCIAMAPIVDSFSIKFRRMWLHVVHLTLEKAGPAFIKWGQWAATRPDLFPQDLCTELTKLHSKAPTHSFAITKKTIEKAFGRKLPEIFAEFEEEPVASGSVAQVHRATLKYRYPGQEIKPIVVAVKVRHPSVGEAIRRDFMIINFAAKISKFIPTLKWCRLDESIQQFAVFMMSQVDLAREAAHLSRFIYNFRRWKDVSFPGPLYPLVHPAVLVETYEHGENVLHFVDDLEGNERIKSALAHIGTHALFKMLLVDNFIHADMHPGNILVRLTDNKHPGNILVQLTDNKPLHKQLFGLRPHVVFLDGGMTAELSKRDRLNLLDFFKAVACQDGRAAAECTLRLSKQQNCPDPKGFIEEVEKCFKLWNSPEGDCLHPADRMQQLLQHVRRHKVNIDGNVCTVIVTTLVLEGWQRKLDPDYDVMRTLQTMLFKADWADSLFNTIRGLMAP